MESHRHSPARRGTEHPEGRRGEGGTVRRSVQLSYIPMSRNGRIRTGDLRLRRHGVPPAFARRRARRSVPLSRRKRVEPYGRRGSDGTGPSALPLSYCAGVQAGIEPATSWVHGVPPAFARRRARRRGPPARRRGMTGRGTELLAPRGGRELNPRPPPVGGALTWSPVGIRRWRSKRAATRSDVTSPPRRSGTRTRSAGAP